MNYLKTIEHSTFGIAIGIGAVGGNLIHQQLLTDVVPGTLGTYACVAVGAMGGYAIRTGILNLADTVGIRAILENRMRLRQTLLRDLRQSHVQDWPTLNHERNLLVQGLRRAGILPQRIQRQICQRSFTIFNYKHSKLSLPRCSELADKLRSVHNKDEIKVQFPVICPAVSSAVSLFSDLMQPYGIQITQSHPTATGSQLVHTNTSADFHILAADSFARKNNSNLRLLFPIYDSPGCVLIHRGNSQNINGLAFRASASETHLMQNRAALGIGSEQTFCDLNDFLRHAQGTMSGTVVFAWDGIKDKLLSSSFAETFSG